jgi:hypothetical protein
LFQIEILPRHAQLHFLEILPLWTGGRYKAQILAADPVRMMHWMAHMMAGFLFQNEKVIVLESRNGKTFLTHKEKFSGILVPLFWGKMEKWVPSMLNAMNSALKKKVEGGF